MKIKKIIAPTMQQAIEKVKQELGSDAVIFHTKKVSTGHFFNLFKKENIEVLAASDPDTESAFKTVPKYSDNRRREVSPPPALHQYVREDPLFSGPDYIKKMRRLIIRQGMIDEHADQILKILVKKWYQSNEQLGPDQLNRLFQLEVVRLLNPERFKRPQVADQMMMLVGPTGVGKTTTIAKLAGQAALEGVEKMVLITADTFRIAAINQLRTYGEIIDIPVEVAYSAEDFQTLIEKYSDYDRVFIDTAGRNYQNETYIRDIGHLIDTHSRIRPYLVLSATAKYEDMDALMTKFNPLHADRMIITKIDETKTYGGMISAMLNHPRKHLTYVTNGQEVPEDLRAPDIHTLINRMLGDC
ncbi:flagellar biosynthesis regulator FlhF [Sporolactobacillus sp. Y61]|uniref:Flagellar biosynthesis protein FlhF n=1 Tax=Sporolactobacillus sp. Y61 TaxID=3160863 RepID=A0AAU8ICP2_9BACL